MEYRNANTLNTGRPLGSLPPGVVFLEHALSLDNTKVGLIAIKPRDLGLSDGCHRN
jgi:hypothetical protein